jgi:hypothetical protein
MIRDRIFNEYGLDVHFRLRGKDVTRLEALSDGIFSLAIALLVVSSQVPASYKELLGFMEDFAAFFLCMLMIISIWKNHYHYFLRYGLRDQFCLRVNTILLFLVLFYVYPLKFLFKFTLKELYYEAMYNFVSQSYKKEFDTFFMQTIQAEQISSLVFIFTLGLGLIQLCFVLLYVHAYQNRNELALSPVEILITQNQKNHHLTVIAVCAVSLLICTYAHFTLNPYLNLLAGVANTLIPVTGFFRKRKFRVERFRLIAGETIPAGN